MKWWKDRKDRKARALADNSNQFGFELMRVLARASLGNLAISPFSIASALGMTALGARGDTAAVMNSVLHTAKPGDLSRRVQASAAPATLRIANRVFTASGLAINPAFVEELRGVFGTQLEELDVSGNSDGSRVHINDWVAAQTEQRITNLLAPGTINALTRLVLVNAIYFLANWAVSFDKALTRDEPFHRDDGSTVYVPMMRRTEKLKCVNAMGVDVVELPYAGGGMSMAFVIPEDARGLVLLERSATAAWLDDLFEQASYEKIHFVLPRFKIDAAGATDCKPALTELGMGLAFDENQADFSGIAPISQLDERLYISAVVTKTFVRVDEVGTEAAAATAVVMLQRSAPTALPREVRADRPFWFFIRDTATGAILFMGRVVDPRSS